MTNLILKIVILSLIICFHFEGYGQVSCIDSSFRIRYTTSEGKISVIQHFNANNGDILITGTIASSPSQNKAYVMRTDASGNVRWTQEIAMHDSILFINKMIELSDNNIVLAGYVRVSTSASLKMLLVKLDQSGNLLWSNMYEQPPPFSPGDEQFFYDMSEAANGDLLATWAGTYAGANGDSSYAIISRINASGSVIWSKAYGSNDGTSTNPAGIFFQNNEVIVVGEVSDYYAPSPCTGFGIFFAMGLDYNNGDILQLKSYCYDEIQSNAAFESSPSIHYSAIKMNNGHFSLFGLFHQFNQNIYHYQLVLDNQFNLLKSKIYASPNRLAYTNNKIQVIPDGQTHISGAGSPVQNIYWVNLDSNDLIKRQKTIPLYTDNVGSVQYFTFSQKSADIVTIMTSYTYAGQNCTELINLQDNDANIASCIGTDTSFLNILPFVVTPNNWAWKWIITNNPVITPLLPVISNSIFTREDICKQVSSCDSIFITGKDTVCILGQEEMFVAHRNPGCNKIIEWQLDSTAFRSIRNINDSTIAVLFKIPSSGKQYTYIHASAGNCSYASDSNKVVLLPVAKALGNDTTICPGTSFQITPGGWFKNYLWQDGSTGSSFTVVSSGTYYVRVQAYCGYFLSDTIHIAVPQLDVGSDRTKCNNDTIILKASSLYVNYQWGPDYNIIPISDSAVKVYPDRDTAYIVSAQAFPGCLIHDTVAITVKRSPGINMGKDTVVCAGVSLTLDPGAGFASYLWDDGSSTETRAINKPGKYLIEATYSNGCISRDTFNLYNYSSPVLNIHGSQVLCLHQSDTLQTGSGFVSWLWQDGSNAPFFCVKEPGRYWVQTVDSFGCSMSDTASITDIVPVPAGFLPADTSICKNETILLRPSKNYSTYLWSDGSTAFQITANTPGLYSLQVTDSQGCSGTDSVIVLSGICKNKIMFPNAFTPDDNGHNNIFRPIVEGSLHSFTLSIFNRWGQQIFISHTPSWGWDGRLAGKMQPPGAYIWVCAYQFEGESPQLLKGSLLLIE